MKSIIKNLAIFLGLAALLYAGYSFFFAGSSVELDTGSTGGQGEILTKEFLIKLNRLESINFSSQLFDNPQFQSLTSYGSVPPAASAGRPSPFSP